jgi:hypothetical protein
MLEMADIFSQYGDLYLDKYGEKLVKVQSLFGVALSLSPPLLVSHSSIS